PLAIVFCVTSCSWPCSVLFSFLVNAPAPPEISTLSLHDALPISRCRASGTAPAGTRRRTDRPSRRRAGTPSGAAHSRPSPARGRDRKSTRLNSSHEWISYAVFCLKKKKPQKKDEAERHTSRLKRV